MTNIHGLDTHYFKTKLSQIVRDIEHYTSAEMYNEMKKLADVAYTQSELKTESDSRATDLDQDWMYENIE